MALRGVFLNASCFPLFASLECAGWCCHTIAQEPDPGGEFHGDLNKRNTQSSVPSPLPLTSDFFPGLPSAETNDNTVPPPLGFWRWVLTI